MSKVAPYRFLGHRLSPKAMRPTFRGFERPAHGHRRKYGLDFSDKDQLKEIDQHIGRRIRHLRKNYGLSQNDFGQYLGVSFQQIQKYENGTNRCPVSRLYALCQILEVDIQYFLLEL